MNRPNLSKETSQIQVDPQMIKCFRFRPSVRNPQSFAIKRKRPIKTSYTSEQIDFTIRESSLLIRLNLFILPSCPKPVRCTQYYIYQWQFGPRKTSISFMETTRCKGMRPCTCLLPTEQEQPIVRLDKKRSNRIGNTFHRL
jgi:hypothetical protein